MMIKRNKIVTFSVTISFVIVIALFLSLKGKTQNKTISVKFIKNGYENIINEDDIRNIVLKIYPNFVNMTVADIDLSHIEKEIEKNPSVRDADVYKKYGGVLGIEVEQRIPILRIINNKNESFYIDNEGAVMPLSKLKSARVPIANGNINKRYKNESEKIFDDSIKNKQLIDIYNIIIEINKDKFLKAQTEQIFVTKTNEYELIPMVGRHVVMLGDSYNIKKKLKYLKHFYMNVLNKEGWNQYTRINVKYENQIVCTKK